MHALPLPVFVLGVALGALVMAWQRARSPRSPFPLTLGLECIALLALALRLRQLGASGRVPDGVEVLLLLSLAVLAMGFQNAAVRKLAGENVRTTFVTGMLANLAEGVALRISGRPPGHRIVLLGGLVGAYLVGAALGGALQGALGPNTMLVPALGLTVILLLHTLRAVRGTGEPAAVSRDS